MRIGVRAITFTVVLVVAGLLALVTLNRSHGLPALREKERQVRELQEQNSKLARENQEKRDRIRKLHENRTEQELEIRRRLKLLKQKETTFILQDQPAKRPLPGSEQQPR